jgi:hypothetical protein
MSWAAAACVLWGAAGSAWPCSLGSRQLVLQLEPGSAALGARNAGALVDWLVQWRGRGGIEALIVTAPARGPGRRLAQARLKNVSRVLGAAQLGQGPVAYEVELKPATFNDRRYLNSVDLSVQPACIRAGTCCQMYRP